MNIVVDAMGGDFAPDNVVAGVIDAIKEFKVHITLVGLEDQIRDQLAQYHYDESLISIVPAAEVVAMDESPTVSLRQKKNSSISVGLKLLKEEGYDAFISAGNTGAVVAASTIHLRMIEGVARPAIGLVVPTLQGFKFVIDVGANADAKPKHLLQSAQMGTVYAREVLGIEQPSVKLLNIGEEEGKGTDFQKQTYKLMEENLTNFTGNIEPNEIYNGKCDCAVCDGFVGNVVLKVSEGLAESFKQMIKRTIKKNPLAILGALLMAPALGELKKQVDYAEYGGAPLLGVNGIVMIGHGRSSPKAIKNAIRAAKKEIEHKILEKLKQEVN